jgi:hypothetical protein
MQVDPAFLWEYSGKSLKLAQLLGQLGVLLTTERMTSPARARAARRLLQKFGAQQ